jgi:acetyltransferase
MAVEDTVFEGAVRQAGALRLTGIDDFVRALKGFLNMPLPKGGRLAFVTYSGAQAIMSIDATVDHGLQVARLDESTRERIGRVIATASKTQNPVDIFPDWLANGFEKTTTEILKAFLEDKGVDGIICISFANAGAEIYQPMVDMLKGERTKPVFFSLLGAKKDIDVCQNLLEENRIPCFDFPEMAVRVFAHMLRYAQIRAGYEGRGSR